MRKILLSMLALLGCGSIASGAGFVVEEIAPGNFVHYGRHEDRSALNLGDNANIGFIVGERCVAVIDSGGSLAVGRALREAIAGVTPQPVCYVITTHVHPDHFFGAAAFLADRPQYVGHAELPRALAARGKFYKGTLERDLGEAGAGSEIIVPELLVKDRLRLDLGGRFIEVRAWPLAHTDNDLTVFDETTSTLWLADLLFLQHTPVVDGSILGFLRVLDDLAALPARTIVPGHGRSDAAWPQVLDAQKRYLGLIVRETRQALGNGVPIQDAVESVGAQEAPNWVNFDTYHKRNVTGAYTELEWED
ncbi:MAG: quinoprotein relay system zinc metallohydrolase 2 [Burkholderiales bacterium]|nr:quinoprotein relay system zinc metallohydrolase 2 [Burkholderiales bacterium]